MYSSRKTLTTVDGGDSQGAAILYNVTCPSGRRKRPYFFYSIEVLMQEDSLEAIGTKELLDIQLKVAQEIADRRASEQRVLKEELRQKAVDAGTTIEALFGFKTKHRAYREKAPAKYKDPNGSEKTWSGRGRKPLWVLAYLEAGGVIDDLLI